MGKPKEEEKKDRTALLLQERKKIIYNLLLVGTASVVVLIGILTMAWFTINKNVEGKAAGVSIKDDKGYKLSVLENSTNGLFGEYYNAIRDEEDPSVLVLGMTADSNWANFNHSTDEGISPGAYGTISFYVTPLGEPVDLKFEIEIVGYVSSTNNGKIIMTELPSGVLKDHLNGHVLLFEEYDVITKKYSKPILSNNIANRVFTRNFESQKKVDIYWVWPERFSNLVDVYNGTTNIVKPIVDVEEDDYEDIVEHICTYPSYYFRNESSGDVLNNITETKLINDYVTYSSLYDAADNDIGTGVDYLLLKMKVTVNEE